MGIRTTQDSRLFSYESQHTQTVWMSHGDEVVQLPAGFKAVATSEQVDTAQQGITCGEPLLGVADVRWLCAARAAPGTCALPLHFAFLAAAQLPCPDYCAGPAQGAIVALECPDRLLYGLQYHPEVQHSSRGVATLRHFLFGIAKIPADWRIENILEEELAKIRQLVPDGEHVICALSGGVDSTVAATLVHKALGERLHCVFVDNGLLRLKVRHPAQCVVHRPGRRGMPCLMAPGGCIYASPGPLHTCAAQWPQRSSLDPAAVEAFPDPVLSGCRRLSG